MSDFVEPNRGGDPRARRSALEALANEVGLSSVVELHRGLKDLTDAAKSGRLTDTQVEKLERATGAIERLTAFDSLWTFGQRYMRHKFVSQDPRCPNCENEVPHRTILICPSCGKYGPWESEERVVASSYVHYLLSEQVKRLMNNALIMPDKKHYADGMLTAMPRGGAKSTWLCEIAGAWLVITGRSMCLLMLSNTVDQVVERSNEIKTELEENRKLIEDFGVQEATRQSKRTWTKSEFILPNKARVIAKGAMQSMRGVKNRQYRPDVVLSDDSDDEKFLTTPDQADKMYQWWDSRVNPACHPNAVFMYHGTVIGEMALLWQMMQGHRGHTFRQRRFKAIQDRAGCSICGMPAQTPGPFDCPVCHARTEAIQPCSYWGARFTVEALNAVKSRIGHWAWQTEFDQSPHDDSTSWFKKKWLDDSYDDSLAPLKRSARRIIPWSAIKVSLTGEEAVKIASIADPKYATVPGDLGPYQVMLQSWDPAWARKKGKDQQTCWMAGVGMGLTWDDKIDIFWIDRDRNLAGNGEYREWMYRTWRDQVLPIGDVESRQQVACIVESNAAGTLFQYDIEEHWNSIPLVPHTTGVEKHDLENGIPGLASSFKAGEMIIRAGGSPKQRELADELVYELKNSGRSKSTDILMAVWFGWSFIKRWQRDIRDPARYDELVRRRTEGRRTTVTH